MSFAKAFLNRSGALLLALTLTTALAAQVQSPVLNDRQSGPSDPSRELLVPQSGGEPQFTVPAALPRMAPELALTIFEERSARQALALGTSIDTTVVEAELPDAAQKGTFELKRYYSAPKSLSFGALKFVGDNFVKTNIIVRLLQSEVDHVEKGQKDDIGINSRNYKFSYKGTESLGGHLVHIFQVKPRQKRVGLFKGRIFVDVYTGSLRRAEGTLVRSPSFFIKKLGFVQDYDDFAGFTLPVHIRSFAKTRLLGRAVVDIFHRDYDVRPAGDVPQTQSTPAAASQTYR